MRILLVVYDNESYIHQFPQGLAYIAAVLLKKKYDVEIYSQDINHFPDKHLTDYLDKNKFDVIGVSIIGGYYQYRKLLKISEAINKSKQRPFYIIGGHGPSPEPEFFINKSKADAVVIGEGEITILELLEALANRGSFSKIRGIAYKDGHSVVVNDTRPPIKDIDTIPFPAYDLFDISYYRLLRLPYATNNDFVMSVLSGRGCIFECNFCYRMDKGYRPRSSESIIEEVKLLKNKYGITYVLFSDELLMSSLQRTERLCKDFIKYKLNIKWCCDGRLNFARPDILRLMKKAGCKFINYGIESLDDQILRNMNKILTTKQIKIGVEATLKAGIAPGLNVIFGNIGENRKILDKGVKFILKYDVATHMRTIRPVTPYPGSPLYYYAIKKGLLKDCQDFYENKHLNSDLLSVNFTELTEDQFNKCLLEANTRLIKNYFRKKSKQIIEQARKLYLENDASFRGFRQT